MKAAALALLASASLAFGGLLPGQLVVDGVTYTGVVYQSHDVSRVKFLHDTGLASLPLSQLPPDLQARFNYDPAKAAEAEQRLAAEQPPLPARPSPTPAIQIVAFRGIVGMLSQKGSLIQITGGLPLFQKGNPVCQILDLAGASAGDLVEIRAIYLETPAPSHPGGTLIMDEDAPRYRCLSCKVLLSARDRAAQDAARQLRDLQSQYHVSPTPRQVMPRSLPFATPRPGYPWHP